ncbi:MAG: gliding motility lipoprotein GldJ, partial [Bacteroidales bacterium]
LRYRPYTAEELADRRNFNKSDNDDYLDGDYESAIVDNWLEKPSDPISTSLVYDFGKTTLISDRSRVVKGGSWKDRAFFLSPGERRFLDQNLSTDWIGFRCAMSRVGSANGGNIVTR